MVLDRLPDDLKISVFCKLQDWRYSYKDLAHIALCCRLFYRLAVPILYSDLNSGAGRRTLAFLSTILDRPDLARYVKRLDVFGDLVHESVYLARAVQGARIQATLDVKIKAALERACEDEELRSKWYRTFWDNCYDQGSANMDAITALLLLYLPNLSSFRLPKYPWMSDDDRPPEFINFVFARASELQKLNIPSAYSLSQLRDFEIAVEPETENLCLDSILPFLQLKSIRHVTCKAFPPDAKSIDDTKEPITHVTHLSFPESNVPSLLLANFIKRFTRLTKISYIGRIHYENYAETYGPYPFIPSVIRDGIAHLEGSLQELTLIHEDEEYDQSDEGDHKPENKPMSSLGSLVVFSQLRRLEVTASVLLGRSESSLAETNTGDPDCGLSKHERNVRLAASLPRSLEELALRACENDVFALMDVLFERKRLGGLGKLKNVTLFFQKDLDWDEDEMGEEGERCEAEGKKLGIEVTREGAELFWR